MSTEKESAANERAVNNESSPTVKRTPWTTWDVRRLKTLIDARTPIASIAHDLERTEAAVKRKAVLLRVSLARR